MNVLCVCMGHVQTLCVWWGICSRVYAHVRGEGHGRMGVKHCNTALQTLPLNTALQHHRQSLKERGGTSPAWVFSRMGRYYSS